MRKLLFNVKNGQVEKDTHCNFDNIMIGTKGYLQCEFRFDEDWFKLKKIAVFELSDGSVHAAPLVNNSCIVPDEVTDNEYYNVYLIGSSNGTRAITNKVLILQKGV